MTAATETTEAVVDVAGNLAAVIRHIATAADAAGRVRDAVTLVAISKLHGPERIAPALEAGHRVFGENRVQEAAGKWPALKRRFAGVELHLVGPLQTNKVKQAVALFDVIESVDRPKLARALAREMAESGRRLPCYIEVNTGEEPQKAGVMPAGAEAFVELCVAELGLPIGSTMMSRAAPPAPGRTRKRTSSSTWFRSRAPMCATSNVATPLTASMRSPFSTPTSGSASGDISSG